MSKVSADKGLEELMPRCKTKDTEDFPELIDHLDDDPKAGCWNCRVWEAIDRSFISKEAVEAAFELLDKGHGGGNYRRLITQAREALGLGEEK